MKQHIRYLCILTVMLLLVAACNNKSIKESSVNDATDITSNKDSNLTTKPTEELKEDTQSMKTEDAKVNEPVQDGEHFIKTTFTSAALSSAKDGSSNEKKLYIYLPPNYYFSDERYPVIYYFHGFGDPMNFITSNKMALDKNMLLPENKEFIVVEVDGSRSSSSEGSFWVNSPVTGQWEDYVVKELVPYIDDNYRTIAKAEARGLAGYSMGGFASLNLALSHPDIFCATISFCPGVLKNGSIELAMSSWNGDGLFLRCYGQSFAPNEANGKMCDIPALDGSAEDGLIIEKWENGFGNFDKKLDNYLSGNKALKAIQVVYGSYDYYKWIIESCEDLSELMTARGIEHTLTELKIGHNTPPDQVAKYIVPFFAANLAYNE